MKLTKVIIAMAFFSLAGIGCASKQVAQDLDAKLAKEQVESPLSEVPKYGFEQINKSTLTEEQKSRMNALMSNVVKENSQNKMESLKLKKVLFRSLATTPYNTEEISLIKERLTSLDKQKLKTMFTALDEVRSILGVDEKNRQHLLEMMMEVDRVPTHMKY